MEKLYKPYYRSFDGKEFETEKDCLKYERKFGDYGYWIDEEYEIFGINENDVQHDCFSEILEEATCVFINSALYDEFIKRARERGYEVEKAQNLREYISLDKKIFYFIYWDNQYKEFLDFGSKLLELETEYSTSKHAMERILKKGFSEKIKVEPICYKSDGKFDDKNTIYIKLLKKSENE